MEKRETSRKRIFIYLFEGFSDWEIAYLTPEINKSENFELVYFSKDGSSVSSMGGLHVVPDAALHEIQSTSIGVLVLPGGTAWERGENREIDQLTRDVFQSGNTVAAMCAATTYLGQLGMLDKLKHTSNDLNYLKAMAPNYAGEALYENSFSVLDNNLITANGVAPIEFAKEVFKKVGLYESGELEKWFQLFKYGVWQE